MATHSEMTGIETVWSYTSIDIEGYKLYERDNAPRVAWRTKDEAVKAAEAELRDVYEDDEAPDGEVGSPTWQIEWIPDGDELHFDPFEDGCMAWRVFPIEIVSPTVTR